MGFGGVCLELSPGLWCSCVTSGKLSDSLWAWDSSSVKQRHFSYFIIQLWWLDEIKHGNNSKTLKKFLIIENFKHILRLREEVHTLMYPSPCFSTQAFAQWCSSMLHSVPPSFPNIIKQIPDIVFPSLNISLF